MGWRQGRSTRRARGSFSVGRESYSAGCPIEGSSASAAVTRLRSPLLVRMRLSFRSGSEFSTQKERSQRRDRAGFPPVSVPEATGGYGINPISPREKLGAAKAVSER